MSAAHTGMNAPENSSGHPARPASASEGDINLSGRMFAFEHYGVLPDVVVLGKGLGGGIMPLAAVLASEKLNVAGKQSLGHYTHEKNPVACAAALATLRVIRDENLVDRAKTLGEMALRELSSLARNQALIGEVRGLGLLLGIELVQDHEALQPANAEAERVMYECLRRGLNFKVTMGNILTLTPALTVSEGELRLAFSILQESIAKTAAAAG